MAGLTISMQEAVEFRQERQWREAGIAEADIQFSRLSGMHAADVSVFREASARGLLIVIRCPRVTARPWHGSLPPKNIAVKDKTGPAGVAESRGRLYVSDYDLMCIWRHVAGGPEKVVLQKISASAAGGASKGAWRAEARDLVRDWNDQLMSRIQHGCQDDWHSRKNPGLKEEGDHFAAFVNGTAEHLPTRQSAAEFYKRKGLSWLYDAKGKYVGPIED